jgi:two-component system sensor histidine kinase VanS
VAHDLRTPLTSIIGYLELVSDQNKLTPEVRRKYIEVAYNKSKRLEKLIEDLFAYTNYSFGQTTLEITEIDMVKFMNQLIDEFYPSFTENKLEYEFVTSVSSAEVLADGNLLARAFANLIGNAIKYGSDGKRIEISLHKENGKVIVAITNYGRLIPEDELDNIFERFYRVEGSRSSETGGTGIGLAIVKSIIKMHEGTIHVKSDLNGTVFQVALDEMK